jgi:hypothetical protein
MRELQHGRWRACLRSQPEAVAARASQPAARHNTTEHNTTRRTDGRTDGASEREKKKKNMSASLPVLRGQDGRNTLGGSLLTDTDAGTYMVAASNLGNQKINK